ncbi:MAG: DNA glycosylase [Verrucomicrobiia bacterium]
MNLPAQGDETVNIPAPPEIDLNATLGSGQTFAWTQSNHTWSGWIDHRPVSLFPSSTPSPCPPWLHNYFHLHLDWPHLHTQLSHDPHLRHAIQAFPGLRLIRDPWWPCLVGFLCSSLKPIPQIRLLHHQLRHTFGTPSFPSPETIAQVGEAALRRCRLGYRARFIHRVATTIASGHWTWDLTPGIPLQEASARLQQLPGVGEKIARCVLLYTGTCLQAFPLDVWTTRILTDLYWKKKRPPKPTELLDFADRHFGPYAGIAQLYLFHWFRNTPTRFTRLPPKKTTPFPSLPPT